jgi:hypothetical protein
MKRTKKDILADIGQTRVAEGRLRDEALTDPACKSARKLYNEAVDEVRRRNKPKLEAIENRLKKLRAELVAVQEVKVGETHPLVEKFLAALQRGTNWEGSKFSQTYVAAYGKGAVRAIISQSGHSHWAGRGIRAYAQASYHLVQISEADVTEAKVRGLCYGGELLRQLRQAEVEGRLTAEAKRDWTAWCHGRVSRPSKGRIG